MSEGKKSSNEPMRTCPTCRMDISIFATKCRFCGEPVGRPRDEARRLTVDDLGGVSESTLYTPGADVLDALEEFRKEEEERARILEEERANVPGFWESLMFWRPKKKGGPGKRTSYDQLDVRSRELLDIGMRRKSYSRRRQPVWTRQVAMGAAFVAAVVLLYFGGRIVKATIDDYLERKNAKPTITVDNNALAKLRQGSVLGALEEAMGALSVAPTAENEEIANTVRKGVADYIEGRLNSDNWSDSVMHQIEDEVNRATTIDPYSEILQKVKGEVREEVRLHSMTFSDPNPEAGTVTLRLVDEQKPVDLARIGEKVHGRFEIMNITREQVRFKDHQRSTTKGIPRQFVLDKFGSFSSI